MSQDAAGRPQSLSIFFPAYNEEANLPTLIERTLAAVRPLTDDFEIIIVNDGSSDRTQEVAEAIAREHPQVRPVRHEVNKGYGGALITGFESATRDAVFFSDSDNQFDLAEIAKFWELIGRHDAVIGYRIKRADPFMRKVNAFCWGRLIRVLFGFKVRDLDCAFKMFRRGALEGISLGSRGATITVELMARLHRKGVRWVQVGVHHYPRKAGVQTGAKLRVILRAFADLFRLRRRLRREQTR
ncbi:MAG: Undecaprenyl-phosphate 4-deoxy-4-formamido-L-arabinose transferase [Phycisphaerae bacterium]|nr:Undecaprenyl-phosphate 4-deoxy-4-formamido-L-arabinose transferase [Phycisphaerae bacterium]